MKKALWEEFLEEFESNVSGREVFSMAPKEYLAAFEEWLERGNLLKED